MSPQIFVLWNTEFQAPRIEQGIKCAMDDSLRANVHPTAGCHLTVISYSHLGGNVPVVLIIELADHHGVRYNDAGSVGTGTEKP